MGGSERVDFWVEFWVRGKGGFFCVLRKIR